MAGEVTVNRAAMATAASQVEDALGTIRGLQSRLNGINEELGASWKGDASAAFAGAFERFSGDFAIVINALQGMQERLVGSRANYDAAEAANTAQVNKITAALNR
jgi:WXG100 family type VII secretion target